jgi:hypothetical protein
MRRSFQWSSRLSLPDYNCVMTGVPTFRKRSTQPCPYSAHKLFKSRNRCRSARRSPGRTRDATEAFFLSGRLQNSASPRAPTSTPCLLLIHPVVLQAREQLQGGSVIEQAGDRKAISGLIGPHGGLRLRRIDPIDRTWVKSQFTQMYLRHLGMSPRVKSLIVGQAGWSIASRASNSCEPLHSPNQLPLQRSMATVVSG